MSQSEKRVLSEEPHDESDDDEVDGLAEDAETAEVRPPDNSFALHMASLEAAGRMARNWFYWIAALSLINSAILHFGGNIHFVVGLGITMVADGLGEMIIKDRPEDTTIVKVFVVAFDVFVLLVVCGFGWISNRRYLWVFALGMVLYLLDGVLFVLVQEWMSAGFHAFVLFSMWGGLRAYRQYNALEQQAIRAQQEKSLHRFPGS